MTTGSNQNKTGVAASASCWACKNKIKAKQKLCANCSTWQDWRRHFGFSSMVLALLVALVSVSTPVVQNVSRFIDERRLPNLVAVAAYEPNWQAFSVTVDNLTNERTALPSELFCSPLYLRDQPSDPPELIYKANTSTIVPGNGVGTVNYVFLETFEIEKNDLSTLIHFDQVTCESRREVNERYDIFFRLQSGVMFNFRLNRL